MDEQHAGAVMLRQAGEEAQQRAHVLHGVLPKAPQAEAKRIMGDVRWRYVEGNTAAAFVDDLRRLMG